jgi:hypothetical protein
MPTWNTLLDLTDLYEDLQHSRKTIVEFSQTIANRLSHNAYAEQLAGIIEQFRVATTPRDVDAALQKLWDFADVDRRIFVKVEEETDPAYLN